MTENSTCTVIRNLHVNSGVTETFGALRNVLLGGPFASSLFPNLDLSNKTNGRNTVLDKLEVQRLWGPWEFSKPQSVTPLYTKHVIGDTMTGERITITWDGTR